MTTTISDVKIVLTIYCFAMSPGRSFFCFFSPGWMAVCQACDAPTGIPNAQEPTCAEAHLVRQMDMSQNGLNSPCEGKPKGSQSPDRTLIFVKTPCLSEF